VCRIRDWLCTFKVSKELPLPNVHGARRLPSGIGARPGGKGNPGSRTTDKAKGVFDGAGNLCLPKMTDGWFMRNGERVPQSFHEADGPGGEFGRWKGSVQISRERGLNLKRPSPVEGGADLEKEIVAECKSGAERPDGRCCVRHLLMAQPDFLEQDGWIAQEVKRFGHECRFLPKAHPELNPIERFWAGIKTYLRQNTDYTIASLVDNIKDAIRSIPLAQTQRYFRGVERMEAVYLAELDGNMTMPMEIRNYAMKQYSRHRGVPKNVWDLIEGMLVDELAQAAKSSGSTAPARKKKLVRMISSLRESRAAESAEPMDV
jgi:hypothetical protein